MATEEGKPCTCDATKGPQATMQALQFNAQSKNLAINTIDVPKVTGKNVLIKVAFAGVCGGDLHIIDGQEPCKEDGDVTLGHEISGTVAEVGEEVTTVKVGDKVVVDPNSGCMACEFCRNGKLQFCQNGNNIGRNADGGWADYCAVPELQVHKLPCNVTLEQAVFGVYLSTLSHARDLIAPLKIGQKILVIGAGITGSLCVCLLHLQGHKNVVVSEPKQERRSFVERLSTDYDLVVPEVLQSRLSTDSTYSFDLIAECTGSPEAVDSVLPMLNYGGTLCILGVAPPCAKISVSPYNVYSRELRILGVLIDQFSFASAINLAEALGNRYLDFCKLGVKCYELKDYCKAFEDIKCGGITKAVFKFP